jgi:carbon starvation protein
LIGQWALNALLLFYGIFLMIMGLTVEQLIFRYWRLVLADFVSERRDWVRILGNKYVATVIIAAIGLAWISTFTFDYVWEYFGGTNQLFAAFALLLAAVYLVYAKRSPRQALYTFIPGLFMAVTTISALIYVAYLFLAHSFNPTNPIPGTLQGLFYNYLKSIGVSPYPIVSTFDVIAFLVGISLAVLSAVMTYYLVSGYFRYREVKVVKA